MPVEDIKVENVPLTMKNDNCTFNDNIGVQHVNIPQNVFDIIIKYNAKLENDDQLKNLEIDRLQEEIAVLNRTEITKFETIYSEYLLFHAKMPK